MRRYELDLCRIFACLMIIMIHLSGSGWHIDPASADWRVYNFVHTAVRAGIPLFFMISGALFLSREELDWKHLLCHNLLRLLGVYVFWSMLYELNQQRLFHTYDSLLDFFIGMSYGHYHLWFIPAMVLVYLFLPILHGAIHGKPIPPSFILIVFLVVLVLKATLLLIPNPPLLLSQLLSKIDLGNLKYFVYMILGYWLSTKTYGRRTLIITPVVFFCVVFFMSLGNQWHARLTGQPSGWFTDYFALPIVIASCCVFCFFLCFREKLPHAVGNILQELSNCTLGSIFSIHLF